MTDLIHLPSRLARAVDDLCAMLARAGIHGQRVDCHEAVIVDTEGWAVALARSPERMSWEPVLLDGPGPIPLFPWRWDQDSTPWRRVRQLVGRSREDRLREALRALGAGSGRRA